MPSRKFGIATPESASVVPITSSQEPGSHRRDDADRERDQQRDHIAVSASWTVGPMLWPTSAVTGCW